MQKLMQSVRNEFGAYIMRLDDYDVEIREKTLDEYMKELENILEIHQINSLDLYELKYKIKDLIRFDYRNEFKIYERNQERLDEQHDTRSLTHKNEENAQETNEFNEKQKIAQKTITQVQETVEYESQSSSNKMKSYLSLMLDISKKMTQRELINQGYYNLEEFMSDLSHIPIKVLEDACFEYDEQIKDIQEKTMENLEQKFSDFSHNQEEKVFDNTKNVLQYEELYEEYITNGSKTTLNLGKKELDIDLCVLEPPKQNADGEYEKGVAVSKSILDQAVKEENSKLVRDDENYVKVEANNFYFLVKLEEHEKIMKSQEKQQIRNKKIEKKRSKDEYGGPYL